MKNFLYFNFKLPQNIFKIGLVHEAIWGGTTHLGKQPATFEDYFRIFRASHGSESAILMDQVNALGNHLGIWDFAYIYENKNRMKFYYQHFSKMIVALNLKISTMDYGVLNFQMVILIF